MGIKMTGLDDFQRHINELTHRAESLSGTHRVPIADLLTSEFILLHTDFDSVEAMFIAGGFRTDTQADFDAIPEQALDAFCRAHTRFDSWEKLLSKAGEEYISKRLFEGL